MIALNRFCEGEGIKVRRLYEWLRRRKIKYINNPILVNTLLRTAVLSHHIHSVSLKWRKTGQEVLSEGFSIMASRTNHLP